MTLYNELEDICSKFQSGPTIRLINEDSETVLAWARGGRACIIFNLHVEHTPAGIEKSGVPAYSKLPAFLKAKDAHDPRGIFTSDWHRWLVGTLAGK